MTGCGYTIQGKAQLPFESVSVTKIVNKTYEPRLQDKMQIALTNELLKSGFAVTETSGYRIQGDITVFQLNTLAEKEGVAVEYEVVIRGNFKLSDPSGTVTPLRDHGVFIVSFYSAAEDLNSIMAAKEVAIDRALRDFASEIVASILYRSSWHETKTPEKTSP